MNPIVDAQSTIVANDAIRESTFRLSLFAPEIASLATPGQFVMLECCNQGTSDPLLRRPMTIYRAHRKSSRRRDVPEGVLQVVYQVRGRGTVLLSRRRPGESLRVLGPLGNGFRQDRTADYHVLVGGGTGTPALMMLAERMIEVGLADKLKVLIGGHTQNEVCGLDDWIAMKECKDIGVWITRSELAEQLTAITRSRAERFEPKQCTLYACGPHGMLRYVAQYAASRHWPCQVSLESNMACGLGACQSCVCRVRPCVDAELEDRIGHMPSYRLICKDGPVFDAKEVDWDGTAADNNSER